VHRIKSTVEKISDGRKWLILIDELFKGTNVEDAMKCSTTVIKGLLKMKNSLFILSTHLYEIGDELKIFPNIRFNYFETLVKGDQLFFNYQLKEGISVDRLGYFISKKATDLILSKNHPARYKNRLVGNWVLAFSKYLSAYCLINVNLQLIKKEGSYVEFFKNI
jgi:hypothetical protein